MTKNRIISIVIAIILLAGIGYKVYEYNHPEIKPEPISIVSQEKGTTSVNPTVNTLGDAKKLVPVKVNVETPINGTYKGVIEVGASGFNAFVVNIDKDKNWEIVSKEFGESLAWEGFANTSDIYAQLKKYIGSIANKGVAGRNIHFVVSSGALKVKNIDLVIKSIEEKGFVVNRVSASEEGKYALKASLPKDYVNNSFSVDMGSGNTKINWYENGQMKTIELPGAKYYAIGKTDDQVKKEVLDAASKVPVNNRKYCFIIGGVPSQLAKQVRASNERFTQLSNPDDYSAGDDVKLKSGLNIYRAISDVIKCDSFIFDWDANFTIGFLMTLN